MNKYLIGVIVLVVALLGYSAFTSNQDNTEAMVSETSGAKIAVLEEPYDFVTDPIDNGYKDNRSDFGAIGGLGLRYDNIGSGLLFLEGRYQQGFVVTNPVDTPPPGYSERKNTNITVSLTYLLFL